MFVFNPVDYNVFQFRIDQCICLQPKPTSKTVPLPKPNRVINKKKFGTWS